MFFVLFLSRFTGSFYCDFIGLFCKEIIERLSFLFSKFFNSSQLLHT